jgi:hypothetical protein
LKILKSEKAEWQKSESRERRRPSRQRLEKIREADDLGINPDDESRKQRSNSIACSMFLI